MCGRPGPKETARWKKIECATANPTSLPPPPSVPHIRAPSPQPTAHSPQPPAHSYRRTMAILTKSAIRDVTDEFTRTKRSTAWGKWLQSECGVAVSKERLDLLFTAMGAKGAAKTKDAFLDKAVPIVIELLAEVGIAVVDDTPEDDEESLGSVGGSVGGGPSAKVAVTRAAGSDMGSAGESTLSGRSGIMSKTGKTDLTILQLARGKAMKDVYAQLTRTDLLVEEADGTQKKWSTLTNGRKLGVVSKLVSRLPEIAALSGRAEADREAAKAAKAQAQKRKDAEIAELLLANGVDLSKLKITVRSISLKA